VSERRKRDGRGQRITWRVPYLRSCVQRLLGARGAASLRVVHAVRRGVWPHRHARGVRNPRRACSGVYREFEGALVNFALRSILQYSLCSLSVAGMFRESSNI